MDKRKKDHIEYAFESRMGLEDKDQRFIYEPMHGSHREARLEPVTFAGKTLRAPIWVSSMTGGTRQAYNINRNLARVCKEFGLGMGLGSCRPLLESKDHLEDFDVRSEIGEDLPLYANLGIAQIEHLIETRQTDRISEVVAKLRADGLIIHVNPLQESLQPEGDRIEVPPAETIQAFLELSSFPVIVKEVGQGMGPESLRTLMSLPLAAIELAGFGGTNFSRLELLRVGGTPEEFFMPLSRVGHTAEEMVEMINQALEEIPKPGCQQIIVSGGIRTFLDGWYLINKLSLPAIYGQASSFLKFAAEGYEPLRIFVESQIRGLEIARAFLKVR